MCFSWTNKEFEIINARHNHEDEQVVFGYTLPTYFMILYYTMGMSHLKDSIEQYNFLFPSILQNLKWWSSISTTVL
jgi:hypothetical protein